MKDKPHQIQVALFCGGRGSATIIHELLHWPNVHLTLIVNAYDDGLSTGALREFVTHMLGPSDFRKNLSYLLDPFSEGQYALKHLLEFRLPKTIHSEDISNFFQFIKTEKLNFLMEPVRTLISQLNQDILIPVLQYMKAFFTYAEAVNLQFDYRDCSFGNILFAGAYLDKNNNFNAATKAMGNLVSSRAELLNVSQGENRILAGLKEDGALLANEAELVSPQSSVPIRGFYFLTQPVSLDKWNELSDQSILEKEAWLKQHESLPGMSPEAEKAVSKADVILFGPGTQHSSLFPSYRIAHAALKNSSARIKTLVMNLEPDHDIQACSTKDIIDRALFYMNDPNNLSGVLTHVLIDKSCALSNESLHQESNPYKNSQIIYDAFANPVKGKVHNGREVVKTVLHEWERATFNDTNSASRVDIFIDIDKRSLAMDALYEEFLEINWKQHSLNADLVINQTERKEDFPEIHTFSNWLNHKKSEYLVLLTGDGEYRFRDVMLGIKLLEQSHFGAVFGSRNQSRLQFKTSLQAAYGERKLLSKLSAASAFFISIIFSVRFGVIFSDPLTGFRIFKRSRITHRIKNIPTHKKVTPITIAKHLIRCNVEIAELPVNYRTFSGFTDPKSRIRRGLKNLVSLFARHRS
ncbi:MAG TPA: 2-phospho-L-lactate transferase CofD family protein [Gammaproteobacteria bacterium]|nr:2-phospho-L-lactate transferase CofD family protein [Gammaproteobacteria bacterium]